MSLWVEAYDYGDTDPAKLKHATAVGAGGAPMKLEFEGWGRTLQQQATIVQFAITNPPASIRVGQPVTVTTQQGESTMGVIVSREAVVRGNSGEALIWRHVEPEKFEPRPVRTEPFDAEHFTIVAGASDGDRIVVRGADLINQIR
jgi:membrane fusion protein, heavy metal efflux system